MKTRAALVWALGFCVSFGAMASGCYVELDDFDGHDFDGDDFDDGPNMGDMGSCPAFCQHLMNCENITMDKFEVCLSHCEQQRAVTPGTTAKGIECVLDSSCSSQIAQECPSAPFPGVSSGNLAGSCEADCDCPSGSVCIGGSCKLPCNASCECPEGEACVEGYCREPVTPPVSCMASCDCPSGNICDDGICKPPQ